MDYAGIIRRAFRLTWRYKAMWTLGIFAGGIVTSGGSYRMWGSKSSGLSTWLGPDMFTTYRIDQAMRWLEGNITTVVIAGLALAALGTVMWTFSIAARGGLMWLVNEEEEQRPVRVGAGWGHGFRAWWSIFIIGVLMALPLALLGLVVLAYVGAAGASAIARGYITGVTTASAWSVLASGGLLVLVVAAIALIVNVTLSIVSQLAQRYAVLERRRTFEAIGLAWRDLWGRRGAFVMLVVMYAVALTYGMVLALATAVFALPGFLAYQAGAPLLIVPLAILGIAVLLPLQAAYGTFTSAAWTVFFRAMRRTGEAPSHETTPPTAGEPAVG